MPAWIVFSLKSLSLFFLTLVMVRLLGKRQASGTTPFSFITYTVIGILTSLMIVDVIPLIPGFLALLFWITLAIGLDYLSLKSKWVHDWVNGKETILIKQGKVMEENLLQVRLTAEELLQHLRSKQIFNAADVEFAVMETTGDINVLLKSDKKPLTAHDLGWKTAPQTEPQTVILDGNILDEPLANMGLNRAWLKTELAATGVSLNNVFIAQIDSTGDLHIDLFDDAVQIPQPKVKKLLYANLEKAEADMKNFSLETENKEAKKMYEQNAARLTKLKEKLEPYLLR